jgi:hypothetical protein
LLNGGKTRVKVNVHYERLGVVKAGAECGESGVGVVIRCRVVRGWRVRLVFLQQHRVVKR